MENLKRDYSLAIAWLQQSGMDWVKNHEEITLATLLVLFLLVSCGS